MKKNSINFPVKNKLLITIGYVSTLNFIKRYTNCWSDTFEPHRTILQIFHVLLLLLFFAIHLINKNKLGKNSQIIGGRFSENSNENNNANSYRSPKCISVAEEWRFICLHQAHCHQQIYFNEAKLLLRTLKISNKIQQTNANFCHTHGSWAILPLDMNTNTNDMESNKTYEHTKTHQHAEKTAPWCF